MAGIRAASVGMVLVNAVALACGTRTEMGFSNVPGLNRNRQESQEEGVHDVIANGRDSCQREAGKGKDPAENRLVPCEEEPEAAGGAGGESARPHPRTDKSKKASSRPR